MFTPASVAATKAAFLRIEAELLAAAPAASRAGAEIVAREAARRAPRDTGATAASITVTSDGATAHAGPQTAWARFTEYGTIYISPEHWLLEAGEASTEGIIAAETAIMKVVLR